MVASIRSLPRKYAGVVHENVQFAELLDCCSDGSRPRRLRGHVKGESQRLAARVGDFLLGLVRAVGQHVADHD
jgi:hypothetical protein